MVPPIEDTLLALNNVAGCASGYAIKSAGTWINPPPPAIASTKPDANAVNKSNSQR